jgi:large subunit ribosomal protein L30
MLAVIRIRGSLNLHPDIRRTLELLSLKEPNHCILLPETDEARKMALKTKDYIAFGEINEATLSKLLQKRGRKKGNKRLGENDLKLMGFSSFNEMAGKLIEKNLRVKDFGVGQVFRLKPPRKGFERKGIKKDFRIGGVLGFRGREINELLQKMI